MAIQIQIPEAFEPLFQPKRYKVLFGGRGGAKSHNVARALLVLGMQNPLFIVCGREIQKTIKNSVHKLLADIIRGHSLTQFYKVLDGEIRGINGTTFIFIGLKHNTTDTKSLEGCDILWIEEAENVSNNTYEIIIPTIRKKGSEIWITFNPKNRTDPTYERHVANADEDYWVKRVSWRDNPFFPEELEKERLKLEAKDPDGYQHVYEGDFDTRRSGSVYANEIASAREQGRITFVPYQPVSEVFTAWDLGYGNATSIWWLQWVGRELRWLEYYEDTGKLINFYADIIKSKSYSYGKHYLPHDGAHGNIRGETVIKQLQALGIKPCVILPRELSISPGIDLTRQTLGFSVFDEEKCKDGIHALEHYAFEWDEERKIFKNEPKHDWSSNGADAARYAAIAAKRASQKPIRDDVSFIRESDGWMEG